MSIEKEKSDRAKESTKNILKKAYNQCVSYLDTTYDTEQGEYITKEDIIDCVCRKATDIYWITGRS